MPGVSKATELTKNMWKERLMKIFELGKQPAQPWGDLEPISDCVAYYDSSQRFQYTTFKTETDRRRITENLTRGGNSIYGVISVDDAKRLADLDNPRVSGNTPRLPF